MLVVDKYGKVIGGLFLFQVVVGLYLNFGLLAELMGGEGFLVNGAKHSDLYGVSVFAALIISLINLVISSICRHLFRESSPVLTQLFFGLTVINFAAVVFEYGRIMEMVSYSQQYAAATTEQAKLMFETLRSTMASGRNWAHFMAVLTAGTQLFVFYTLLYRSSFIPRYFTGAAMVAALTQMMAVSQPFFGNEIPYIMLAPLGLTQMLMPIYFMVKGIQPKELVTQN